MALMKMPCAVGSDGGGSITPTNIEYKRITMRGTGRTQTLTIDLTKKYLISVLGCDGDNDPAGGWAFVDNGVITTTSEVQNNTLGRLFTFSISNTTFTVSFDWTTGYLLIDQVQLD